MRSLEAPGRLESRRCRITRVRGLVHGSLGGGGRQGGREGDVGLPGGRTMTLRVERQWGPGYISNVLIVSESEISFNIGDGARTRVFHSASAVWERRSERQRGAAEG